ncbi:hypothetical protein AB4K20DRAFT_1964735 [Rhizopus microsporus]
MRTISGKPGANIWMFAMITNSELTVNTIGVKLVFVPEKYVSQSSFEEYKADAVFLLNDGLKFGYGHIKGTFGCLTIYNEIFRTYHFATEETASKVKIYFVHARRKLYNTLNDYLAHLCDSFVVARALFCKLSKEDTKNILAMNHFVWQLKLKRTVDTVQEHDDYEMQRMTVINRHGNQDASQRCQIWHPFAS